MICLQKYTKIRKESEGKEILCQYTKEQKQQENLDRIKNFRLLDDDFMTACFQDNISGIELVIQIIMNYAKLAERVAYFKNHEKGVQTMCKVMEDMVREERFEEKVEFLDSLFKLGKLSDEEIANAVRLTLQEVLMIKETLLKIK